MCVCVHVIGVIRHGCSDGDQQSSEIEVLKKVYQSILLGAEGVGFDMKSERTWYIRNMLNSKAAAA